MPTLQESLSKTSSKKPGSQRPSAAIHTAQMLASRRFCLRCVLLPGDSPGSSLFIPWSSLGKCHHKGLPDTRIKAFLAGQRNWDSKLIVLVFQVSIFVINI